jgi:hypothetical protein
MQFTCMLLKRLKVLLQTAQENCVDPTRISEAEGIQYWLVGTSGVVTVDGAAKPRPPQEAALLLRGGAMDSDMLTSGSSCCWCSWWNRKQLLWLLLPADPPPL